MVEWLERFRYGAKISSKVRVRIWASPCDDWKTLSVNQAVNGNLFPNREQKAAKGEGWALSFISCAQGTVGL